MAHKTGKREFAFLIMMGFGYVVFKGEVELVKVLVWPVFSFAGLAFGLDWFGKSGGVQQPPSFSSVRSAGQGS